MFGKIVTKNSAVDIEKLKSETTTIYSVMSKRAVKRVKTRKVTTTRRNIITLGPTKYDSEEEEMQSDTQWNNLVKEIEKENEIPRQIIQRIVGDDETVTQENKSITKMFNIDEADILVIKDENGDFWYKGKDICNLLDYKNSRAAIGRHVRKNSKLSFADMGVIQSDTLKNIDSQTTFINNSGLFQLIAQSCKNEAEELWDKITKEILPELFATGRYTMPITNSDISKLTKSFYDDNMISDFMENPCVYFAYVGKHQVVVNGFTKNVDVIKYGNTSEISRRDLKEHRKFYETFNVLGIWKSLAAKEVEKKIEKNFESLNMLVNLKIKGVNGKNENRKEHIILTEKHNLDYCLNMIQLVVDCTTLPQENKYLDQIRELKTENKYLRMKCRKLIKIGRLLEENLSDLRKIKVPH